MTNSYEYFEQHIFQLILRRDPQSFGLSQNCRRADAHKLERLLFEKKESWPLDSFVYKFFFMHLL